MTFRFTWSDNPHGLTIIIGTHTFGPYTRDVALDILERLKEILADDGAAMASYAGYCDGSTEIYRTYKDGKDWPAKIKLHAYVEIADQWGELVKLTLGQVEDLYGALEEVMSDIQGEDE